MSFWDSQGFRILLFVKTLVSSFC